MNPQPFFAYQERLEQIQAALLLVQSRQSISAAVCAGAVLLFLVLGFLAVSRRALPVWYPPLTLSAAIVSAGRYGRQQSARLRLTRLRSFCERGLQRSEGRWMGEGDRGEEFAMPGHLYAHDLNLFGRGSLFERLCIARTQVGKHKLAEYLQIAPPAIDECASRQEAVRELRGATELRERIATLGQEFNQSSWDTFAGWLNRKPIRFHPRIPVLLAGASVLTCGAFGLAAASAIPWWTCGLALALQAALGWSLRQRVMRVIDESRLLGVETGLLAEGLQVLASQQFHSAKLQGLAACAAESGEALRQLERWLTVLAERPKEWFYPPSLLLMAGSHGAIAVERWRLRHGADYARWIEAWAEFEALQSLACYAYESPEDPFPEFVSSSPTFEAEGLGHPLLPHSACVRNDVALGGTGGGTRLLMISGSNMSGKSTLLRAVGLGAVLAAAGAPVRARKLKLSLFNTCASLSIRDSIQDGRSKFMAELDRLRETIGLAAAASPPVLFLVDEIFAGTNSPDRRVAAEAVLRTLVTAGAAGAVSTHDLALTEIAELDGLRGRNVHMGSRGGGGGPLDFDYLLKPGITTETNALAIARLAGVNC